MVQGFPYRHDMVQGFPIVMTWFRVTANANLSSSKCVSIFNLSKKPVFRNPTTLMDVDLVAAVLRSLLFEPTKHKDLKNVSVLSILS